MIAPQGDENQLFVPTILLEIGWVDDVGRA